MNAPVKTDNAELIVPEGVFAETVLSVTHYTDQLFRFRMTRPAGFRFRGGLHDHHDFHVGLPWAAVCVPFIGTTNRGIGNYKSNSENHDLGYTRNGIVRICRIPVWSKCIVFAGQYFTAFKIKFISQAGICRVLRK